MKSCKLWIVAILVGFLAMVPMTTTFAGPAGIVSVDQVNLRTAPNQDSAVIGVLYKKDVVQFMFQRKPCFVNGFSRVMVMKAADKELEGMEGWVYDKYLYCPQPD